MTLTALLWLTGALLLFTCGERMMARIMREQGPAPGLAVSSGLQLLLITAVARLWFGERPAGTPLLGMIFGLVSVILIAGPQGGRA